MNAEKELIYKTKNLDIQPLMQTKRKYLQTHKQKYVTLQTIEYKSAYSWFIMIVSFMDFILQSYFQHHINSVGVTFTVIFALTTLIQLIDYVLLIILYSLNKIQIVNPILIIYSALIVSALVSVVYGLVTDIINIKGFIWLLQYKLSFVAPFRGKLHALEKMNALKLVGANIEQMFAQSQTKKSKQITNKKASIIAFFEIISATFRIMYNSFCFIILYFGLFQMIVPGHEVTSTIYFIFVTISTVGYGDVTYNTDVGRILVIIFIFSAIFFFPAQFSTISPAFKEAIQKIKLKKQISNGILILGRLNKSLAITSRLIIPSQIDIAYVYNDQNDNPIQKTLFKNMSNFGFGHYPNINASLLSEFCIERCHAIVCVSSDNDQQTISTAVLAAKQTCGTIPLYVILHDHNLVAVTKKMVNPFIPKEKVVILGMDKLVSYILATSAVHEGFSTFFYNVTCLSNLFFNTWESHDNITMDMLRQTSNIKKVISPDFEDGQYLRLQLNLGSDEHIANLREMYNRGNEFYICDKDGIEENYKTIDIGSYFLRLGTTSKKYQQQYEISCRTEYLQGSTKKCYSSKQEQRSSTESQIPLLHTHIHEYNSEIEPNLSKIDVNRSFQSFDEVTQTCCSQLLPKKQQKFEFHSIEAISEEPILYECKNNIVQMAKQVNLVKQTSKIIGILAFKDTEQLTLNVYNTMIQMQNYEDVEKILILAQFQQQIIDFQI